MNLRPVIWSLATASLLACSGIRTAPYFRVEAGRIDQFRWSFTKDPDDSIYQTIEKAYGRIGDGDTVTGTQYILYQSISINGQRVFYTLDAEDSMLANPYLSSHFLSSAFFSRGDTIFLAPITHKSDLSALRLSDFKSGIPSLVRQRDSIVIRQKQRTMIARKFSREHLRLDGRTFRNCLSFEVLDRWPDTTYTSRVWLDKKLGLLKWIRTTGRTDVRVLQAHELHR